MTGRELRLPFFLDNEEDSRDLKILKIMDQNSKIMEMKIMDQNSATRRRVSREGDRIQFLMLIRAIYLTISHRPISR